MEGILIALGHISVLLHLSIQADHGFMGFWSPNLALTPYQPWTTNKMWPVFHQYMSLHWAPEHLFPDQMQKDIAFCFCL